MMDAKINNDSLDDSTKEDGRESAKACGETGEPMTRSPDVTDLQTSKASDDESKPTVMEMMNTIENLTQQIQATLTSVTSIATPNLLQTAVVASSIKKTSLSFNSIASQMANLTTPLGDFILFPKLPIEIRLKVWREALPGPRVIDVIHDSCQGSSILRANQPPPLMLHVCRESRQEALRIHLQIGNVGLVGGLTRSYAFRELSRDTLFVNFPASWSNYNDNDQKLLLSEGLLTDKTFEKLRYLAIDLDLWIANIKSYMFLTKFKSLLELTLVVHDPSSMGGDVDHETFRMEPTQFELVEVEERRANQQWKHEIARIIGGIKKEYPEWKEPRFTFKTVVRDGRRCCFAD